MVAELQPLTRGGCQLPRWLQTTLAAARSSRVQPAMAPPPNKKWDPTGLLSRPGPHRYSVSTDANARSVEHEQVQRRNLQHEERQGENVQEHGAGRIVLLREEVLEEEEMVVNDETPGRENWKLQQASNGRFHHHVQAIAGSRHEQGISMTDLWPKNWGVYNEQPERDSLNNSLQEPSGTPDPPAGGFVKGPGANSSRHRKIRNKSFLTLLARSKQSAGAHFDMADADDPFCHAWIWLSSLYGKLIVIIMLAFCLTEVMDNSIKLLTLQGIFLMYLYVGSIAVIICIYIWVLIDSCASLSQHEGERSNNTSWQDTEMGSITRFGSLKRAHITRSKTSRTSFYLRVGALAFGLGTLVFNGLEMAMHSMMEGPCLNDVVFVHPVLHGLFTFLQMHFLFVNSQVLVERFGLIARFGFMHLVATNLALWVRLIIWESGNDWTYYVYAYQNPGILDRPTDTSTYVPTPLQLKGFPPAMARIQRDVSGIPLGPRDWNFTYVPVSQNHMSQVVALHECLNTNSLGQLWTSSMPFLFPFIVEFSLIAAAVTYVMGQKVGSMKFHKCSEGKSCISDNQNWRVDCQGASKGLFLGLLCLVGGIVILIIFFVVKNNEEFQPQLLWICLGTLASILSISIILSVVGFFQIRKLSLTSRHPQELDRILSSATIVGVYMYSIFGMIVGASNITDANHAMVFSINLLLLIQASLQSTLIAESIRRACTTRYQMASKPGREVVTFLLFANAVLWIFDTFVTQSWMSQELQLQFYGILAWGVISRISMPLLIFFRFHSCVMLLEIWKHSYRVRDN